MLGRGERIALDIVRDDVQLGGFFTRKERMFPLKVSFQVSSREEQAGTREQPKTPGIYST